MKCIYRYKTWEGRQGQLFATENGFAVEVIMKLRLEGCIGFLQVKKMEREDSLGSEEVTKDSGQVLGTPAEIARQAGLCSIPGEHGEG